ncbi:ABC transporter substrate-binding protein [Devosia sp. LjRoot16]|uniref:ABC transporter substrate-binding protein n=1 Tax=Devosia sp. LjRoot16 TaxID=3342271 RepID=UPI003ED05A47
MFKFMLRANMALAVLAVASSALAADYQQAPMLDDAVSSGTLPAVADRLPADPLVITPVETVGSYGGTWRSGLLKSGDAAYFMRTVAYDGLLRWNLAWDQAIPNVAASATADAEGKTYTFKLRAGMKWSDGTPFTAADVTWVINDLVYDAGFVGSKPDTIFPPANKAQAAVVDDLTFTVTFEKPHGMFLQQLAGVEGNFLVTFPLAYCGKFHPAHNADIDATLKELNMASWGEAMLAKCGQMYGTERWANAEKPSTFAWVFEKAYVGGEAEVTMVRNPYYFKVDTAGNQLPYIDRLSMSVNETPDEIVLKAVAGEIDLQNRHIASLANRSTFAESRESGRYELLPALETLSASTMLSLNTESSNPALKAVFANKKFREALSIGIDRDRINDVVFFGQAQPHQIAPRAADPFYDETMATQFTEFDVDAANALLDEIGLGQRDANNIRLLSDGTPLTFQVNVVDGMFPDWIDTLGLVIEDWKAIGVDARINVIERTLFVSRWVASEYDAFVWSGDGGIGSLFRPEFYVPVSTQASSFGMPYARWFADPNGEGAIEPPAEIKQQFELYRTLLQTSDPATQADLYKQILAINRDLFPVIGVTTAPDTYFVKQTNFRNVPANMPNAWPYPTPGPAAVEQFYIEQN